MDTLGGELVTTQRILDLAAVRARVAMQNLANQNTEGFKAYAFDFEQALREAVETRGDQAASTVQITRNQSGAPGQNNVDSFAELNALTKVRLLQDLFTQRAAGTFDRLRLAIGGGR